MIQVQTHHFFGPNAGGMKLADMHVHTDRSDGTWSILRTLKAAQRRGLSAIVFADHDHIASGYHAQELCLKHGLPLEVIPCSEISARGAHILGFDLEDDVPHGLSVSATVEAILKRGGSVGIPHPGSKLTSSVAFDDVLAMARAGLPVAFEVFNASVRDFRVVARWRGLPDSNEEARRFYEEHQAILGPATAGTDAHYRTIGRGLVAYEGTLREALAAKRTSVLYTTAWERCYPWDLVVHWRRLKQLDARRRAAALRWQEEILVPNPSLGLQ